MDPTELLMTPGPVPLSTRVAAALAEPAWFHHDPEFYSVLDQTRARLAELVGTKGLVAVLPGSGRIGLEAALKGTVRPGERTLHLVNGFFGRWSATIAERVGADVTVLEAPATAGFPPELLAEAMRAGAADGQGPYRVVTVAHCETSTGQLTDVTALAQALDEVAGQGIDRPLLMADAISSIPGTPLQMDVEGVDICVLASQKALGAPMGLSVVAVGPRARRVMRNVPSPPSTWALDLLRWEMFDAAETPRPYPVVLSTHLVRALHAAVETIGDEGIDRFIRRQTRVAMAARQALAAGGLEVFGQDPAPTLTPLVVPDGLTASAVTTRLAADGIRLVGGMGELRERILRLPHMGVQAHPFHQRRSMIALVQACARLGAPVSPDAVVSYLDNVGAEHDHSRSHR